uniref:MYND-type domain-containing protein n=1 Tax=Anopheles minimus TaxID=112268 RepID=A0A182WDC2_9DIPT
MLRLETPREGKQLFNELWESTIKRCIFPEGKGQLNNDQLVQYISRKVGIVLRDFPFRERLNLSADVKKTATAIALREDGNLFFQPSSKAQLLRATQYYNKSIAYAEKGSEERALAYANRSSVCLQLRQYEDCLENIRLARESNCPERLLEKLERREAIAKAAMLKPTSETDDEEAVVEQLKLSYNCHANVPQMVECLQLRRNEEFGRHVVTNRQLRAGDVVIIEKPFASMTSEEFHFWRCDHCHDINLFNLIPCEGCTMAMYCSEECLSKAHQQYHRYECAVLRDLWRISDNLDRAMVGLRTVAKVIALFDHDLDALKEHLDGLDESKVNAFTMDWRTATPKDVYNTVHVLSTNQTLRSRKDLTLQIFFATIIHQLMLERTELGAICATSAERSKLLFDLILRHCQTSQVSCSSLDVGETSFLHGFAADTLIHANFPLIGMLNHSCVPNVARIALHDGRCAVVALSPIAAGEQLFDSYDLYAHKHKTSQRLDILKEYYQFTCRCDACELAVDGDVYPNEEDVNIVRLLRGMKTNAEKVSELISYLNTAGRCFSTLTLIIPQILLLHGLQLKYCPT